MKKVFLVDDEIVIRENVRACIPWEREGFDYCGDASDGEIALPMIEQLRPDIVITDIKMPFMNGLELSAIVRRRWPDMKIIILSGYDEFHYARQALRLGVDEYCLKPVSASDLVAMLRQVADKADKEALERQTIDELRMHLSQKEATSREQILIGLCNGFLASAEAIEQASTLEFDLVAKHYAVAIADIRLEANQVDLRLIEADMYAELSRCADTLSFMRSRTEIVWLFKGPQPEPLLAAIDALSDSLKASMERRYDCSITIGAGSVCDRMQHVQGSFSEAEEDKHWRRLTQQSKVALMNEMDKTMEPTVGLDRLRYIEFLKLGAPGQADAFMASLAPQLAQIDWTASLYGYYLLNDLTLDVTRTARHMYACASSAQETLPSLRDHIRAISSPEAACGYLRELAELFWTWRAASADKYGELIAKVKAYVSANYGDDSLTLQAAADHVNVSASHLSKVFSQETGQTFIEFLMHTRIRKAMELLQASNAKSYEIAYQVGYNDAHYFSNLFKRVTGMNIRDFRKQGLPPDNALMQEGEARA